jgi:hypothetical protein
MGWVHRVESEGEEEYGDYPKPINKQIKVTFLGVFGCWFSSFFWVEKNGYATPWRFVG